MSVISKVAAVAAGAWLSAGIVGAGEKALMHCFAFSTIKEATQADWDAFAKATDAWPGKFSGVKRVWHGKLRVPLNQFAVDAEARKKLAAGEKDVDAKANRNVREYGVCMEMAGPETLKLYTANPYHKEWMALYEKVRVAGTTTYDILGQ
jgi:hypothetical protein